VLKDLIFISGKINSHYVISELSDLTEYILKDIVYLSLAYPDQALNNKVTMHTIKVHQ
jgi:hypothetical protein